MTTISCSIHPDKDDEFRVEFKRRHDHIAEDYFRVRFGEATIYINKSRMGELIQKLQSELLDAEAPK